MGRAAAGGRGGDGGGILAERRSGGRLPGGGRPCGLAGLGCWGGASAPRCMGWDWWYSGVWWEGGQAPAPVDGSGGGGVGGVLSPPPAAPSSLPSPWPGVAAVPPPPPPPPPSALGTSSRTRNDALPSAVQKKNKKKPPSKKFGAPTAAARAARRRRGVRLDSPTLGTPPARRGQAPRVATGAGHAPPRGPDAPWRCCRAAAQAAARRAARSAPASPLRGAPPAHWPPTVWPCQLAARLGVLAARRRHGALAVVGPRGGLDGHLPPPPAYGDHPAAVLPPQGRTRREAGR